MTVFGTVLLAGSLLLPLSARASDPWSPGYQYDMRGDVVRDAAGNCLRTAQWSPGNALAMCDPTVVAQRSSDKPVIGKEARVTGVLTQVDLVVLQAGDAFAFDKAELSEAGRELLGQIVARHKQQYVARVCRCGQGSTHCRRDTGRSHPHLRGGFSRPAGDLSGVGR